MEKYISFFDEIQHVKEWHSVIPSFRIDFDCDIYVTGSNSKLLSGELATNMAGRYVSFHVYPFVLSEIQEFYEINGLPYTREQLFTDYLKYGGLPMRLVLPDEHSVRTYLEDVYDSVVMKDILSRYAIRNENLLRKAAGISAGQYRKSVLRTLDQPFPDISRPIDHSGHGAELY